MRFGLTRVLGCVSSCTVAAAFAACGADAVSRPAAGEPSLVDAAVGSSDAGKASSLADAGVVPPLVPPYLGANVDGDGVTFRVWAPHATAASVTGDFSASPIAMTASADGIWKAHVKGARAGQGYAFALVDGDAGAVTRIDPYCRQLSGASCVVVDPAAYAWKTGAFARAPRTSTVVYEMHVGSFAVPDGAANGTFQSARAALPSLADLGVNVVELMPVQDFGAGPATWGYNPQLYFAPKPSYGTADDLRAFVDDAHALGMGVWIDVVANHMDSWSQAPLRCFDAPCGGDDGIYFFPAGTYMSTPWGPRPNYEAPRVADMLAGIVDWWMGEMRGDGFRWDSVSNIRALDGNGTTPGGKELLVRANDRTHALGGLSVAEDLKGYAAITQPSTASGFAFDAQWDGFGYDVPNQLVIASDANRDLGTIVNALTSSYAGDPFARLLFTEDHDTVGNGGARLPSRIDGANPTSWTARKRSMLGAVLLLTSPGVPMLFQGQESLATGTFANPPAPLAAPTAQGAQIRAFYKDMIRLRENADGGAAGLTEPGVEVFHRNDAAKVVAYRRYGASGEDVIVVVNMMNKAYTEYDIGVDSPGPWRIRLNTDSTAYSADFTAGETGSVTAHAAAKDGKAYALPLVLGAYSAMVLTK